MMEESLMSHYESGRISLRPNISRRPRTAETNRKGFSFARRGMLWPRAQSAPRSNFLRQLIDGMPVRYVAGLVGIVASLSIVLHAEAFAQTPHASFLEPTDSSANVPLSPTIRIRTNFPIDTTRLYQRGDTSTDPEQSVMVVASAFYDHLPDSLIGDGLSFGVKYTVEDDTTLSCTVGYLEYETPYVAIINNLWVITGTGDTVQVPSASVAFTTVLPPHRLESASLLFRNYIRCIDTLTFRFSRPLDSVSAGTIIKVYEFDPFDLFDLPDTVDISDINLDDLETPIPSTSWFDASKEVIYTTVPNMSTEKDYRVRVELHHLTGDSLSNHNYPFHVRTVFRLDLKAVSPDASQPLSQQPDWYPARSGNSSIGDTIRVYAPERIGNHLFSHWSIPAIPSLDSSTANVLVIALDCETVTDVHVEAVYRPMRKGTVEVSTGTHGTVVVHSGRGESLGGEGNYTVYEGESIEVSILPDSGYYLSYWRVGDTSLSHWETGDTSDVWSVGSVSGDNSSSPVLTLTFDPPVFDPPAWYVPPMADSDASVLPISEQPPISGLPISSGPPAPQSAAFFNLVAIFTNAPPESYGTYGEVIIDEAYGIPLTKIAEFTGPGGTNCTNDTWSATCTEAVKGLSKSYDVGILDNCFEIYRVKLYTRDANGTMVVNHKVITTPVTIFNVNLKTDNPYEEVTFYVRRKRIPVQVEEKMAGGADSPLHDNNSARIALPVTVGNATPPLPKSLNTNAGLDPIGDNPQHLDVINPSDFDDTRKYYVLCGSTVTFKAVAGESGIAFDRWTCEAGSGYNACGDTNTKFQITVHDDTKAQAIFKEDFRIVEIGLYQGSSREVTWFPVDPWERPDDIHILLSGTTNVIIRFSRSVDTGSIRGNIFARDNGDRIDFLYPIRHYYVVDCYSSCATWAPYNGNNNAQLTLTLDDNFLDLLGLGVPKMMEVLLVIKTGVTSTSGAPLAQGGKLRFETELPSLRVTFNKLEIGNDGDGDGWPKGKGEIYNLWSVVHADGTGVIGDVGGQSPPVDGGDNSGDGPGIWEMDEGETQVIGNDLMLTPKLRRDAIIRAEIQTRERDDEDFFDRLQTFFDKLGNIATGIDGIIEERVDDPDTPGDESRNTVKNILQGFPIVTDGVNAVLELIEESSDENMGHKIWLYNRSDWWGAHPRVRNNNIRVRSHKVYYTVRFRLQ